LFGPRSLESNDIGAEGAKHIGEALKINKALTSLQYAPVSPFHQSKCARFVGSKGAESGCCLCGPCSLYRNEIGAEGAQRIGEALKINKALTTLKCALAAPQLPVLALLSARGR
jgi:hypothetical protein